MFGGQAPAAVVRGMVTRDQLWKGLIEDFFPQLLDFFAPDLAQQADLTRIEFLDQELDQLAPDDVGRNRRVDKLVKLLLADGKETMLLVHLEVQGYPDKEFPLRMFTYAYRIFDRYGVMVEALAILTDDRKNFRPEAFEVHNVLSRLQYDFTIYKLLDKPRETFVDNRNPFAQALLIAQDSIGRKRSDKALLSQKIRLYRRLFELGYSKVEIEKIGGFIKYYTRFSEPEMNAIFDKSITELTKKEEGMGIIERIQNAYKQAGIEQGKQEGIQLGKQEGIQLGKQEGKLEGELSGRINSLARFLLTSAAKGQTSKELAEVFQLPLTLVRKLQKGHTFTQEEVHQWVVKLNSRKQH